MKKTEVSIQLNPGYTLNLDGTEEPSVIVAFNQYNEDGIRTLSWWVPLTVEELTELRDAADRTLDSLHFLKNHMPPANDGS